MVTAVQSRFSYSDNQKIWLKCTPYVVLLIIELFTRGVESMSSAEIDKHLELGKQLLAKGQLSDALSQYHLAVEGDPSNYLTYFKRGTVYLALGKPRNALSDFDQVLELKPDFAAARISRGTIHLKQGDYDLAQLDFYNVLQTDPYNQEANELLARIDPVKQYLELAEHSYANFEFANAINLISHCIETSPYSSRLYERRAEMHLQNGDELAAVTDLQAATNWQRDHTLGYFKLSQLLYKLGRATEALKSIRECLKLDPEHKDCFPFYKKIKKVEKLIIDAEKALQEERYADAIEPASKVVKQEPDVPNIIYEAKKILCTAHSKEEQSEDAIKICSEALLLLEDAGIYCDRAEAYLAAEMYDDAIRDYRSALEHQPHFDRATEGLKRAEGRQKQAEKRDYYKILGVKRTANKKEITKAYRKMAQKWHPDNYQLDEKMKKIAEKKFIDIAAAKEVLTDDEKRKQFDLGEDPLDPESGRGPNMQNFHHFQSFHGSPFQFRFHFN